MCTFYGDSCISTTAYMPVLHSVLPFPLALFASLLFHSMKHLSRPVPLRSKGWLQLDESGEPGPASHALHVKQHWKRQGRYGHQRFSPPADSDLYKPDGRSEGQLRSAFQ